MDDFYHFSRYLFVFAHPDDEVYTCAFIAKLIEDGKEVHTLYVTSGDYQGEEFGPRREEEVHQSASITGVPASNVHFLRIPERQLMNSIPTVLTQLTRVGREMHPDCVVSHDFEGGHNGHDAVSFCASNVAHQLSVPLYVFPAYHGWPAGRVWNQFIPGREETARLELSPLQQNLQNRVVAAHSTQREFFNAIRESKSNEEFSRREVLREIHEPVDYSQPPENPVGYEYPGSKLSFESFRKAVLAA